MVTASQIIERYISFFEKRGHKQIPNAPLVPENDPTTLFTSSGMQPLVPYLLGEPHPQGKRLVNVQNCFRTQDIDEIGDNRHTTFFRMLGNWSLGDPARNASQHDAGGYFKKEQLPWFFEFLAKELRLPKEKLYVSVFEGYQGVPKNVESHQIWKSLGVSDNHIFFYGVEKNWWSRSGPPDKMPAREIGGPDSEVFFEFTQVQHNKKYGDECHPNCDCGRFMEIGNSVFIQYQKQEDGSLEELSQKNVDFGGGLERLLAAVENKSDVFQTNLFAPIIKTLEQKTGKMYAMHAKEMRIIADHLVASCFMITANINPSNTEQGYILRRLIRRSIDNFDQLEGANLYAIVETIVDQYKETDPTLLDNFEKVRYSITTEEQKYRKTLTRAKTYIEKKYVGKKQGDELMGTMEISAEDAFVLYTTHGLSPTQIKSLGFIFDDDAFAQKMKEHQDLSRKGAQQKFAGGLADHQEKTIMGHTATHLLHQALRDVLRNKVHQTGSNITTDRIRFDFNYDQKLDSEQIKKVEEIVNKKIGENLPVHFEMMSVSLAKKIGAIGLFDEKYQDKVKVYFIGDKKPYSAEFCGGPHVDFTGKLKQFRILKQENIGHGQRRIYAKVHS